MRTTITQYSMLWSSYECELAPAGRVRFCCDYSTVLGTYMQSIVCIPSYSVVRDRALEVRSLTGRGASCGAPPRYQRRAPPDIIYKPHCRLVCTLQLVRTHTYGVVDVIFCSHVLARSHDNIFYKKLKNVSCEYDRVNG